MPYRDQFYLILRGNINHYPDGTKPNTILGTKPGSFARPEYMGSAEFEFGAVPAAWNRMMYDLTAYNIFEVKGLQPVNKHDAGKKFWLFAKIDKRNQIITELDSYLRDKYPLKEWTNLHEHYKPTVTDRDKYALDTDFWWDIDVCSSVGDWIAFIGTDKDKDEFMACMKSDHEFWNDLSDEEKERRYKKSERYPN